MRTFVRAARWSRKAAVVAFLVGVAMLVGLPSAEAAVVSYDLTVVFSGFVPDSTSPYATITFADQGANTVRITFAASLEAAAEFITEWDFNVGNGINPANITFAFVSSTGTVGAPTITKGADCCQADGDGLYDIQFQFQSAAAQRLNGTDTWVVDATATGLDALDFAFLATPAGGAGPFHTAAHVQGIQPNCSGWVADNTGGSVTNNGPCTAVPEPSTMLLLGTGIVGLTAFRQVVRRIRA